MPIPAPPRTYTAAELCRLANITDRQLRWWSDRKIVAFRTTMNRRQGRQFAREEVVLACCLARLSNTGCLYRMAALRARLLTILRDQNILTPQTSITEPLYLVCEIDNRPFPRGTDGVILRHNRLTITAIGRFANVLKIASESKNHIVLVDVGSIVHRLNEAGRSSQQPKLQGSTPHFLYARAFGDPMGVATNEARSAN